MFAGSGELQPFVIEQMKKVVFPESWDGRWGSEIKTIYDMWFNTTEGEVSPLGSGSDYASFWQNGIAAVCHCSLLDHPYTSTSTLNIGFGNH